ncbi:MAG TPA: DUF1329 domain-containing protein [Candidatus Binataceae bacterium]|nr:DUF1329 domain-containing protein [Candidatus Binataceae bacterium]
MGKFTSLIVGVALLAGMGGSAAADPFAPIPAGTEITKANCQKYLDHMTEVLGHTCTMNEPQNTMPPDYKIVIEPTQSYPVPHNYWDATEKYSKQVKLEPEEGGAYRMVGYIAGMPFPFSQLSTSDPTAGAKMAYDAYMQFQPAVMFADQLHTILVDRYGNRTEASSWLGNYVLSHVTDAGYPMTIPNSPGSTDGVYFASYSEQQFPTQNQYLSGLEWDYTDPDKFPQNWVYLPSIRRVIELSQAARCAPFTATSNFSYDDHSRAQLPIIWFKNQYLGTKYEITYVVPPDKLNQASSSESVWDMRYGMWPTKRTGGHWEVRQWLQVASQRLPQYAKGYCEANHYIWLDKEQTITVAYDDFDQNNNYWRGQFNFNPAKPVPGGGYSFYSGMWAHLNPDIQNLSNAEILVDNSHWWFDQDVPARYTKYDRFATPAGLWQVTQ